MGTQSRSGLVCWPSHGTLYMCNLLLPAHKNDENMWNGNVPTTQSSVPESELTGSSNTSSRGHNNNPNTTTKLYDPETTSRGPNLQCFARHRPAAQTSRKYTGTNSSSTTIKNQTDATIQLPQNRAPPPRVDATKQSAPDKTRDVPPPRVEEPTPTPVSVLQQHSKLPKNAQFKNTPKHVYPHRSQQQRLHSIPT